MSDWRRSVRKNLFGSTSEIYPPTKGTAVVCTALKDNEQLLDVNNGQKFKMNHTGANNWQNERKINYQEANHEKSMEDHTLHPDQNNENAEAVYSSCCLNFPPKYIMNNDELLERAKAYAHLINECNLFVDPQEHKKIQKKVCHSSWWTSVLAKIIAPRKEQWKDHWRFCRFKPQSIVRCISTHVRSLCLNEHSRSFN